MIMDFLINILKRNKSDQELYESITDFETKYNTDVIFLIDGFWTQNHPLKIDLIPYVIDMDNEEVFVEKIYHLRQSKKPLSIIAYTCGGS